MLVLNNVVKDVLDYYTQCCNMSTDVAQSNLGKMIEDFKIYKQTKEKSEITWYATMDILKMPMTLAEYLAGFLMAETDGCGYGSVSGIEFDER